MLAPMLLLWPLSAGLTYVIGISLANEAFDRSLAGKTRSLAEQIVWAGDKHVFKLNADLRILLADDDADTHFYRIDATDGNFLSGDPDLPAFPPDLLPVDASVTFRTVDFRDSGVRIAALKRIREPSAESTIVYVAENIDKRTALAREVMKAIVLPQLFVVPLMVFLMWLGLRRGAIPLERMRAQVMARDADDVRPLHAPDAPEEVAPLINAFNDLLARVEREGAAQKRFIANAAHQLRTPLAGIKMQTELALRSIAPDEKTAALNRIADGTARTTHLINQLLLLARTEGADSSSLPLVRLDFGRIARDAVAAAYPLASVKHIDLGFDGSAEPVLVEGHAELLRELVANLVDNAIRYTPAHGRVTVRVIDRPAPTLEVEDNGAGIPQAERELVFERFYRAINASEPGSGLGLAIVREIAARHGAAVAVTAPANARGALFQVTFTAASPGNGGADRAR